MDTVEKDVFHGPSAATHRLCGQIERQAKLALPLLVEGPRGSGKSRVARAIREISPWREKTVHEADLSAEPSSFPDPASLREQGGFLVLENLGTANSKQQDRLWAWLRGIDAAPVSPTKIRLVSTCEGSLGKLVALRRFRADLYLRLRVTTIEVPSLDERREDIPHLIREFLAEFAAQSSEPPKMLTAQAMEWALSFAWPGNVTQLRHEILRAAAGTLSRAISREDFQPDLLDCADPIEGLCVRESAPLHERVRQFERNEVLRILEDTGGVRERAAQILGIDRRTLQRKLRRWRGQGLAESNPQKVS